MIKISANRFGSYVNSLFISLYMLLSFFSLMIVFSGISNVLYYLIILLSFLPLVFRIRFPLVGIVLFGGGVILDIIRGSSNFPIVLLTAPLLALFVLKKKFNLPVLYFTYGIICAMISKEALHGNLDYFMPISQNYISVIMMFNSALITIITYNQKRKIIIWPSVLTLFFSLLAIGRGGILCSSINLFGLLIYKMTCSMGKKKLYSLLFLLFVLVIVSIPTMVNVYEEAEVLERIRDRGLENTERDYIWGAYLSSMNFERVITGYDYTKNKVIHYMGDNPHNSYLKLHSCLGILIIIPFFMILKSLWYHLHSKEIIYILLLIPLLLRAYTDSIVLWKYDFVFFVLLMHPIISRYQYVKRA